MQKKISIVMSYFNRKSQLLITLQTIKQSKYTNFEVIIVDDNSSPAHKLTYDLAAFPFVRLVVVKPFEKTWVNPCVPYNIGFKHATGDIIIIQNPECCHVGDILSYVADNLGDDNYLTFSCFASQSAAMNAQINGILDEADKFDRIDAIIKSVKNFNYKWYNHPQFNPSNLHFVSAITKTNLDKLKGFDEVFRDGYCFDDNAFLASIRYDLDLVVKLVPYDKNNPFCVHLCHDKGSVPDFYVKFNRNQALFRKSHEQLVGKVISNMQHRNLCRQHEIVVNSTVRVDFDYHQTIVSAADLGRLDIKTNISNLLQKYYFIIKFSAVANGDSDRLIIDNGLGVLSHYDLSNKSSDYTLITKLNLNKWNISAANAVVTNLYVSLGSLNY